MYVYTYIYVYTYNIYIYMYIHIYMGPIIIISHIQMQNDSAYYARTYKVLGAEDGRLQNNERVY